jgi:hypothetical protein
VGTAFENAALLHDDDAVGLLDGGEAVGNDDGGAALGELVQGALDDGLALGVDARCGLVQDEDTWVVDIGPHEADELPLPNGEHGSALHDVVIVATGKFLDEIVHTEVLGGLHHGLAGDGSIAEGDVVVDGVGEEEDVLQDHGHALAQPVLLIIADVHAIDGDAALIELVETAKEVDDAGLA